MLRFKNLHSPDGWAGVGDIVDGAVTGVVIDEVLTGGEIHRLLGIIPGLEGEFRTDLNYGNGFSLPSMFGQVKRHEDMQSLESYLDDISRFPLRAEACFGGRLSQLIEGKLSSCFGPMPLRPIEGLLPFSIRVVFPLRGGLFLHRDGELLPAIHERLEATLRENIIPDTMMSWFLTLQQPERGGELWVADSRYSDHSRESNTSLRSPDGVVMGIDDMESELVSPAAGSLLMFHGGAYWHRVLPPADGCCDRITLGGFMALSTDRREVCYWA